MNGILCFPSWRRKILLIFFTGVKLFDQATWLIYEIRQHMNGKIAWEIRTWPLPCLNKNTCSKQICTHTYISTITQVACNQFTIFADITSRVLCKHTLGQQPNFCPKIKSYYKLWIGIFKLNYTVKLLKNMNFRAKNSIFLFCSF